MGGSSPRVQPPVVQPIAKTQDRAVQEALSDAIKRRGAGRGFRSTVLSKVFLDQQSAALQETLGS